MNLLGIARDFNSVASSVGHGGGYGDNSSAVINSGGFASGGITMNATINVASQNITRQDVRSWVDWIADDINEALGRKIR